jgi:hypothetical protein
MPRRYEQHGMTGTPEWKSWSAMQQRCYNKNYPGFHNYGGRGIRVFGEWRRSFLKFFAYIGKRPSPQHSVDRINNERGYRPGNVRWATKLEQQQNMRKNILFEFNGVRRYLRDWSRISGLSHHTIAERIRHGLSGAAVLWKGKYSRSWKKVKAA